MHRRLTTKNENHLNEVLNEMEFGQGITVRARTYLSFGARTGRTPSMIAKDRFIAVKKLLPALLFFSDASSITYEEWKTNYKNYVS